MLALGLLAFAPAAAAISTPSEQNTHHARQAGSASLQVDLGYSIYQGYYNDTSKLNIFKGIRFAKAPLAQLRWQAPQAPDTDRGNVIDASNYSVQCPQNEDGYFTFNAADETDTSEDCLFLNVWTPSNTTGDLPVMVWIHGGGYGSENGRYDLSELINTNNDSFVGVSIQYRLGAFGFLSSDEVYRKGVPNAGLLDQHFALQWVQQYIHLFNGDKSKVTVAGESAGAGSVMLQAMAYGGTKGTELFVNSIAASPYLPMQYGYKDWIPSQAYYAFAIAAGCDVMDPYLHNGSLPIFECLQGKDSKTLINASMTVSQAGSYGTWAFLPVTDGTFVQDLPSVQLNSGKVNGVNGLFGNNANEGWSFVPQDLETEDELRQYLKITFPLFSNDNITSILQTYPSTDAPEDPNAPLYATSGDSDPTAINQSSVATGQQQRANLIYGESVFICPSYWLANAYSHDSGSAYHYQFSIPPATHSTDLPAYFPYGPPIPPFPQDFNIAFRTIFGNFITTSNPSISNLIANGVSTGNETMNPVSEWPVWEVGNEMQVDLNTTCPEYVPLGQDKSYGLPYCKGGGNRFRVVDAGAWEGGRGERCEFWRRMGSGVPE